MALPDRLGDSRPVRAAVGGGIATLPLVALLVATVSVSTERAELIERYVSVRHHLATEDQCGLFLEMRADLEARLGL